MKSIKNDLKRIFYGMISEAFDTMYSEYKQKFVQIARSYVQDQSIAEDIVTESFIAFWIKKDELPEETNIKAYILGIAKKKCLMYLREQKIHRKAQDSIYQFAQWELQQSIAALEDCELTKQLFTNEVAAIFQSKITSLPELTQQVYRSHRFENLNYQEIAQKYNLSQNQVHREMRRALTSLRFALKDYLPVTVVLFILKQKLEI